jgi:hypothetical protein
MNEVDLMYLGKKAQVTIEPDFLLGPLYFAAHGHKVRLREDHARKLIELNPRMFLVTGTFKPETEDDLFSDEGMEGAVVDAEMKAEKPLSQRNKKNIAAFALEHHETVLDPDEMSKREMLAEIDKLQED